MPNPPTGGGFGEFPENQEIWRNSGKINGHTYTYIYIIYYILYHASNLKIMIPSFTLGREVDGLSNLFEGWQILKIQGKGYGL